MIFTRIVLIGVWGLLAGLNVQPALEGSTLSIVILTIALGIVGYRTASLFKELK